MRLSACTASRTGLQVFDLLISRGSWRFMFLIFRSAGAMSVRSTCFRRVTDNYFKMNVLHFCRKSSRSPYFRVRVCECSSCILSCIGVGREVKASRERKAVKEGIPEICRPWKAGLLWKVLSREGCWAMNGI